MRITDETTRTFTLVLEAEEMYDLQFIADAYIERYGDDDSGSLAIAYAIVNHDNGD
jgi:hypothetical protein